MDSLAVRVASSPVTTVSGRWLRHASALYPEQALHGRVGPGRWGSRDGFPVLYLGRPLESVVVEAYRHLVDPVEDPTLLAQLRPRILVTADVRLRNVLDLSTAGARATVGLTVSDLESDISDDEAYQRCQVVAQVAHQLGLHGVLAPAATRMGQTLAVFTDLFDAGASASSSRGVSGAGEFISRVDGDMVWTHLPPDPRQSGQRGHLRMVRDP